MSFATGVDAQVGIADETVYGTFVAPVTFVAFTNEGVTASNERVESESIRPGSMILHENDWDNGREGAEGPLEFEWADRGMAPVAKHMLGKITSSQPDVANAPSVWEHVIEVAPLDGQSFSYQVGRPNSQGVVKPWSYSGGKVNEWELSQEIDGYLGASLTLDFQQEDRTKPLAVATFIAAQRKLLWTGATITVDGVAIPLASVSLSGSNNLRTDRYYMQGDGSELKEEPLDGNGKREYSGNLSGDYRPELEALYDKFVSGTPAALVAEWQGRVIEDTFRYGLKVEAPSIRIDGGGPTVGGPEALEQGVDFTVTTRDGLASPLTFTITDDQAPA